LQRDTTLALSDPLPVSCLAPEIWRRQSSHHTDQYCLAISYAELRFGRRPFPELTFSEFLEQTARLYWNKDPDLEGFPVLEKQVLLKALAKIPDDRYPSCLMFVQELQRAVAT
jgi:serine/threonine protein kinase